MPLSQCRKVSIVNGKIYITCGKTEREFDSRKEAREFCKSVLDDTTVEELLAACLIAWALTQADTDASIKSLETKRAILDFKSINGNILRIV